MPVKKIQGELKMAKNSIPWHINKPFFLTNVYLVFYWEAAW